MGHYRKKPVVIEAWQITAEWFDGDHPNPVHEPFAGSGIIFNHPTRTVHIQTLEGEMLAREGDWIVKEPFPTGDRTFYPCKPEIFEQTYEAVIG